MSAQIDMMDAGVMDRPKQPTIPPRPIATPELIHKAAVKFASEQSDCLGGDHDDIARDVAKHWQRYYNGYELAKNLESYAGWSIDGIDTVEALDTFGSYVDGMVIEAETEWARAFDIQPPYDEGTRVSFKPKGETGVIDDVYDFWPARYLIKVDGSKDGSRRIVKFEDVEPSL